MYLNCHFIPRTLPYHTTWLELIFFNIPGSGHSYSTCVLGCSLRHTLVRTQFYDIWVGTQVIQHALVGMQFYDMPWSGCSCTICLFGTQFNMSWLGHSFTTIPGRKAALRHVFLDHVFPLHHIQLALLFPVNLYVLHEPFPYMYIML